MSTAGAVSGTVTATISPLDDPQGLAVSPDGTVVYVALFDDSDRGGVAVIDTATNTVTSTIPLRAPFSVAVSPDGTHAYVGGYFNTVWVINTATNTVITTIPAGTDVNAMAVSPDGTRAYAASVNPGSNSQVSVIDTATNTVTATIPLGGSSPTGVAVSPDGNHLYVPDDFANALSVINTAANTVTSIIEVTSPQGVAVSPDGSLAYVTADNHGNGTLAVIDTATNTVITTIPVAVAVRSPIAVSPDGTRLYVSDQGGGQPPSGMVSVISLVQTPPPAPPPPPGGPCQQIRQRITSHTQLLTQLERELAHATSQAQKDELEAKIQNEQDILDGLQQDWIDAGCHGNP